MAADGVGMGPRGRVAWLEVRIEWTHYARRTMGVTLCPLTMPRGRPATCTTKNEAIIPPASTGLVGVCLAGRALKRPSISHFAIQSPLPSSRSNRGQRASELPPTRRPSA